MTALDRELLAEKAAAVERHLERVQTRLPADAAGLQPATDASDSVILHLWQAVQITIDLALAACLKANLGTPANYGEAFRKLRDAGWLEPQLADRLAAAAGFRNVVAHGYERLDMEKVYRAASSGPQDLRRFLAVLATHIP